MTGNYKKYSLTLHNFISKDDYCLINAIKCATDWLKRYAETVNSIKNI